MKPVLYAYMITVLVLTACSSGKTTFERGNYYEAVITSVNRLRRNSDHKKSVETLRQAYPMAVAFYEDRAKTSLASAEPFKWTGVVNAYATINTMHDEIKRCPGALAVIPNPVNYYTRLQEAKQHAAEEHYAAGIVALQFGDRQHAKTAYGLFKTANDFVPGYKEVNGYLEAALAAATVKILVESIPVHSKTVGVSAEFFNDKISEFVHSAPISEFVRFYTPAEAQKLKLNPDHIIQLQFDDFTVGQVYKHEKEIQLTKDSVVMGSYVTGATTNASTTTTPVQKDALVVTGNTGVVVTKSNPVTTGNTGTTTNSTANPADNGTTGTSAADAERAARERAEKERLEKERLARELAEKQRLEKEQADKAAADRLKAQQDAATALAEKARLEKEAADKALAEKAKAEKEAADKALADKAQAEKAAAEKALADKALAEKAAAEKAAAEKALAEKAAAEKALADKARADKEAADKALAEKAAAEKEAAAKEKAEKEKAEKEKAEKEKAEKAKLADPSIKSEDTLDVKDPVTICHIPPGNKMNVRTLVINRAALKAHLAHGDSEGGCGEKKDEKGKPSDNGNQGDKNNGGEPKKDKGPAGKGTGKLENNGHFLRYGADEVLFASVDTDPGNFLRYLDAAPRAVADTNKVYGTVKATLYHFTKSTTSKGVVSFRIVDAKTGALLTAEKLPGEFVWVSEWATFNGDERALTAEQLKLTKLKEQPAPAAQELFIEFTRPIYDQITTKIRDFYKNY